MRGRRGAWLALGAVGAVLLFALEHPLTILLGVCCLLAFIVWGVFLVATPEFTAGDDGG